LQVVKRLFIPDKNGNINPAMFVQQICGLQKDLKGIQAIAGLTFGTETIPKVYKIFGPEINL
jgi:histidinol dehydrogenase